MHQWCLNVFFVTYCHLRLDWLPRCFSQSILSFIWTVIVMILNHLICSLVLESMMPLLNRTKWSAVALKCGLGLSYFLGLWNIFCKLAESDLLVILSNPFYQLFKTIDTKILIQCFSWFITFAQFARYENVLNELHDAEAHLLLLATLIWKVLLFFRTNPKF